MNKIKIEFTDGTIREFPMTTYNTNYCDCFVIRFTGIEAVNIPLVNIRTWELITNG